MCLQSINWELFHRYVLATTRLVCLQLTERSGLEQDLGRTVDLVRAKRAAQEQQAETDMYTGDVYGIKPVVPGQPLPPPPVSSCLACVQSKRPILYCSYHPALWTGIWTLQERPPQADTWMPAADQAQHWLLQSMIDNAGYSSSQKYCTIHSADLSAIPAQAADQAHAVCVVISCRRAFLRGIYKGIFILVISVMPPDQAISL